MTLAVEPPTENTAFYNALSSVEDASAEVRSRADFQAFLREFAELAVEYELADTAAAFLLHRHFALSGDQVIVEALRTLPDGRLALVSMPMSGGDAAPTRWALDSSLGSVAFRPLEFSIEPMAHSAAAQIGAKPEFLASLAALIRAYDLEHHVGLALKSRGNLEAEPGDLFVEESTDHESIVTVMPAERALREDAIETTWGPLIHDDGHVGCTMLCICRGYETPKPHTHSRS